MNIFKLFFAYINMMVPTPSEEWELIANEDEAKYLIVHQSGRWYEKILEKTKDLFLFQIASIIGT